MRLGVLLPTFRRSPTAAFEAAAAAARAGLDGVFAYDHIWPMGSPDRPALAPFEVLTAVAVREPQLAVGPLVARVGLVDDHVLLAQFAALHVAARGRLVAGLGPGDRKSAEENLAYGIALGDADERRASLRAVGAELLARGVEVWIGDGAEATRAVARDLRCSLNLWQATPEQVADSAVRSPVTWAGAAPSADGELDEAACVALLVALRRAGARWAVFTPSMDARVLGRLRASMDADDGAQG